MNPERDRDRLLEDALRHELRAASTAPATDACLDAETVAAWMDGGLDAHGMAMAESHAAGCARCQTVLATIARTPQVVAIAAPQATRLWRWWFAPLAATAAAVTVWMVVPQDRLTAPPAPAAIEMAAPETAAAKADVPAAPASSAPPEAKEQAYVGRDRAATANRAEAPAPMPEAQTFATRPAERADAAEARGAAAPPSPAPAPAMTAALRKQSDPAADATARFSPSPNVIWLVGRGGTVHLAVDGQTFVRVQFPEAVDLTAVTATDERRAVVTTVDGRTFRTEDGGRSWQRP